MAEVTDSPVEWVADHTRRYLETGGEEGHEWRPGVPTLLLTTTGRKSGVKRRTALIYGRDGDRYVVVASGGGERHHPAWYLNLRANPRVTVQVLDDVFPAVARTATGAERQRLWRMMARRWPDYDRYRRRAGRVIPVVVLEPER